MISVCDHQKMVFEKWSFSVFPAFQIKAKCSIKRPRNFSHNIAYIANSFVFFVTYNNILITYKNQSKFCTGKFTKGYVY